MGRLLMRAGGVLLFVLAAVTGTGAATVPGGGSKRTDCIAQVSTTGTAFPAGRATPLGVTCADGDTCDPDGNRNGSCRYSVSVCVNMADASLPRCQPSDVARLTVKAKGGQGRVRPDLGALEQAIAALGLPSTAPQCSTPVDVVVPVGGPNKRGQFEAATAEIQLRARNSRGKRDRDAVRLVCIPGTAPTPTTQPPPPPPPAPALPPGPGLQAAITGATVAADGTVRVAFTLTDDEGVPVEPVTGATDDPDEARVRFTIAVLEVDTQTREGFTTTFTRYRNYVTITQTSPITSMSSDQPAYDAGGTLETVDAALGSYAYNFATVLPPGFAASLTHTVGAQIEREFAGQTHVANPVHDFIPAGGPVTTVRELTTTDRCNACHGQLAEHGGGRRELRLCQLCHTSQAVDPDTGNAIDLKVMIHKIHRGAELPSVEEAVGDKYSIIGRQQSEAVYGERVKFCNGGPRAISTCETDTDCEPVGTCVDSAGSTIKTVGTRFPREVRDCVVCHSEGATSSDHREKPSAAACQACHDDSNPGETPLTVQLHAIAPGTNHVPGSQPDALCRVCHVPTGPEFGIGVAGAHTVPTESAQLEGLRAEISGVTGPGGAPVAAGAPLRIAFRATNDAGTPVNLASFGASPTVRFNIGGPGTDFAIAPIAQTAVGGGSTGTLSAFDGSGDYTYDTGASLPMTASGTWRAGLEIRRTVTLQRATCRGGDRHHLECTVTADCPNGGTCTESVQEGIQNPVFDFRIGGGEPTPRRMVVETERCQRCHGIFSRGGFSVHGQNRATTEYCVLCHNPTQSDFARRRGAVTGASANGGDPDTETINFKHLIHRLHTGVDQQTKPYIVYGFGSPFTPHDFSEIRFPSDRRRCAACHVDGGELLPLADDVLPTRLTMVDASTMPASEVTTGEIPPVQDACLSCHDSEAARAHAETQTTSSGGEACDVCHGEGRMAAVSEAHALSP